MKNENKVKDFKVFTQIETIDLLTYENQYKLARIEFENCKYLGEGGALEKGSYLLRDILIEILMINHMFLSKDESIKKRIDIAETREELQETNLEKICSIFDDNQIKLFESAGSKYGQNQLLLNSINYTNLAKFINGAKGFDNDSDYIKLGTQQLLNSIIILLNSHKNLKITAFHLLANFTHITNELIRIKENNSKLEEVNCELSYIQVKKEKVSIRPFNWYKLKGMLINESDGSRNIAFKVDTFVNILTTIFLGISENINLKPLDEKKKNLNKIAKEIIFTAGYNSGTAFGWTMDEIIQKSDKVLTTDQKIKKWCDFDSDVGFGLLSLYPENISADEIEEVFTEKGFEFRSYKIDLKLSDNFIVHKRDSNDVNLCTFIAGYIKGVLEKIIGQPLSISHAPNECQQFSSNYFCLFHIETKKDVLVKNFLSANEKYSDTAINEIDSLKIIKQKKS